MKTYAYRGYTANGTVSKGLIEALNPKAARETLAKSGVLVDRLNACGGRLDRALPANTRGMLYRELASLLKAGMPLVSALAALMKTPELEKHAGVMASVRDHVREGGSLAASLRAGMAGVSAFEAATIDVAERTASLDQVLEQLAVFMEGQQLLRERLVRAMIYPAFVFALGLIVAVVMLGVLVPRTQQMMGGVETLPWLTRAMLAFGDLFIPWGLVGLGGLGLAGWASYRHLAADERRRTSFDRRLYTIPLVGGGYHYLVCMRFARTLSILVRSGVSLVEGVPLAGRATGSAWCERLAVKASNGIRHGRSLEAAVRDMPPLADTLPGWISVGETGGDLAGMLEHAADRCARQFDHFLSKALALLEPLLLLLIGGFVLLVALAVMLPVFSLTKAVLQ